MMNVRLATNIDQEKVLANNAAGALGWAASELAANLMRIVAGAGKPYDVYEQAVALVDAYEKLQVFSGGAAYPHPPTAPIAAALLDFDWRKDDPRYCRPSAEDLARWERDGTKARERALQTIADYALRWRSAQLVAQPTQEATAESSLSGAARKYAEL